ncbi:MAG TPA: hypothetical protein VEP90_07060 [Methylomirabilota bacterium]|nr:hypothetical protein [Methylomirabilota bacterium]
MSVASPNRYRIEWHATPIPEVWMVSILKNHKLKSTVIGVDQACWDYFNLGEREKHTFHEFQTYVASHFHGMYHAGLKMALLPCTLVYRK